MDQNDMKKYKGWSYDAWYYENWLRVSNLLHIYFIIWYNLDRRKIWEIGIPLKENFGMMIFSLHDPLGNISLLITK